MRACLILGPSGLPLGFPCADRNGERTKVKPAPKPALWLDTCDAYLLHVAQWLRHPPQERKRRGNPSPLAAQWIRFGAGRLIIDAARQEQSVSDRQAAQLIARHILKSDIVRSLTPDERQLLNIPEPAGIRRIDIEAFADWLHKGDQD